MYILPKYDYYIIIHLSNAYVLYISMYLIVTMLVLDCTATYSLVSSNDTQFTYRETSSRLNIPYEIYNLTSPVQNYFYQIIVW